MAVMVGDMETPWDNFLQTVKALADDGVSLVEATFDQVIAIGTQRVANLFYSDRSVDTTSICNRHAKARRIISSYSRYHSQTS